MSYMTLGSLPNFVERALPWSEADNFDSVVNQFQTEVMSWQLAAPTDLNRLGFSAKWNGFFVKWKTWYGQRVAQAGPLVLGGAKIITGSDLTEFESIQSEFNELRRQFIAAGGQTTTKPAKDTSALEEFLDKIPWTPIFIIGGLVAAGYFLRSVPDGVFGSAVKRRA